VHEGRNGAPNREPAAPNSQPGATVHLELRARLSTLREQLSYVPRTLRLIWKASPGHTLVWGLLLVVDGLIPAGQLLLVRLVVDSVVDAIGGGVGWPNLYPVVLWGGLMGAILLVEMVLASALTWLRAAQAELTRDYLSELVHEKATLVDFAFYELPEYHDLMEQVEDDLRDRPLTMLESFGDLAQSVITLTAMAAILVGYGLWLPVLLVVSTLPTLLVVVHHSLRYHSWWKESTVRRRWTDYYDSILTEDTAAAEIRLFELGSFVRDRWRTLQTPLRTEFLSLRARQDLARVGAGAVTLLATGGAMAWMVWQAVLGRVTLGDIALLYQALNRGQSLAVSVHSSLGQAYSSTVFLGNLFEFLELQPQIVSPDQPVPVPSKLTDGVSFKGVGFSYPGNETRVFDGFDFHVPAGTTVAIVGSNGAGKSTLMKLLCRLYDPQQGSVELDGVDIRQFALEDYRRKVTALFQSPAPFFATVRENIEMGQLDRAPGADEVVEAARLAGAHAFVSRLPDGYETLLGKWFPGGQELSGGEWQRLALARSFLREAEIVVLDEPTSFLDSWSEIDWFDRFRQLAEGRTAILITHRFSTARYADTIHVMEGGSIVESGTHEELVARRGRYARSWQSQMREVEADELTPPPGSS